LRIAFCADVVGRPGRSMLKFHVSNIREKFNIDCFIVNYENASHGYGISIKNAKELLNLEIDMMTGGNHSWDKKDILAIIDEMPILRPINYPKDTPGKGIGILEIDGKKLAIINLMGHYTMPMVDNPFTRVTQEIDQLLSDGIKHIFIDMHAEATSEKRALLAMFKGKVSAICGSHTHVGTDDLVVDDGTCYVSDVGLTGCRDNVLGMDSKEPMNRFLTGISSRFDVPNKCKRVLQAIIFELDDNGKCIEAFKVKAYDENCATITQNAYYEK